MKRCTTTRAIRANSEETEDQKEPQDGLLPNPELELPDSTGQDHFTFSASLVMTNLPRHFWWTKREGREAQRQSV